MKQAMCILTSLVLFVTAGCGDGGADAEGSDDHAHEPGDDPGHEQAEEQDHAHDETPLGSTMIGELEVELAQGHGAVVAGAEGHLVVKLPYSDGGSTVVRAWIGGEDRTLSYVGKGEYAASHDDYDVHATAPDPLPADPMWWIEIEQPDGTKLLGSAQPILE